LSLSEHPITYYFDNRFVITEDRAYFVPHRWELDWPIIRNILGEIFDLEDPEVFGDVRGRLAVGRIIVGDYFPSTEEVIIQVPLGTSDYVNRRLKEVFGDV
jgi:hypothetical protein